MTEMTDLERVRLLHRPVDDYCGECGAQDFEYDDMDHEHWPCHTALIIYTEHERVVILAEIAAYQDQYYRDHPPIPRDPNAPPTVSDLLKDVYNKQIVDQLNTEAIGYKRLHASQE